MILLLAEQPLPVLESPHQQHGVLTLVVQQTNTFHFLSFISQVSIVVNATKITSLDFSTDVTSTSIFLNEVPVNVVAQFFCVHTCFSILQ